MPMSRQDYKLIANAVNDAKRTFVIGVLDDTPARVESEVANSVLEWLSERLSAELKLKNDKFDEDRFRANCGFDL